jgi:methyl-accepting chemotaxis protein
MNNDPSRIDADPPPPTPPRRFLGLMLGRRRTLVVDARYQLRVVSAAAGLMLVGALLFAGAIHLETLRLHEIVSQHDPDIARALRGQGSIDILLMATIGVALTVGAVLLALVETHKVAGPALSLRRALERIQTGDYTTPAQVRRGDRLHTLAESAEKLRETLAKGAAEEAELLESLAERVEAAKGEEEAAAIGAELRDRAAQKRLLLRP